MKDDQVSHKTLYELAKESDQQNDPFGWFEKLYETHKDNLKNIPWVDHEPNIFLVEWVKKNPNFFQPGQSALVIGCGHGDDAEYLSQFGLDVTAFDISETIIKKCQSTHINSKVDYHCFDLFHTPSEWENHYDFVLEIYTLQAIPEAILPAAAKKIASFVNPSGHLLCISRGREPREPVKKALPRPLLQKEFDPFLEYGLAEISFENFIQKGDRPIRRFRALYKK